MIIVRRIVGKSMEPTFNPGQTIVGLKKLRPNTGNLVVVKHGSKEKIKRIHRIKHNLIYVVGDNPVASTDSRHFGWVEVKDVVAVVVWPKRR